MVTTMSKDKKSNYAEEAAKLTGPKKKKDSAPKVKKCCYQGCPINASTAVNNVYSCCFHDSGQYHYDVTLAIKNNKKFLQNYNNMVRWSVQDWINNKDRLLNHPKVPMGENETPSGYISRFFTFISEKIKTEASEMIEKRLNHV